jgi:ABC-2 type transport system permease protein
MLADDLRGMFYIALKELKAYYFKSPNISGASCSRSPSSWPLRSVTLATCARLFPALLAGKILGGMTFGLTMTLVVLAVSLAVFGSNGTSWLILLLALLLSATAFSALGAFVSVAVKEVFEAQTLANFIRFPMMFLAQKP